MAILWECGICGQEHRFRDEHAGRQAKCKECSARIDIPRSGLGGILDGTTPLFTPPVILIGVFLIGAVVFVIGWEVSSRLRSDTPASPSVAVAPQPRAVLPSLPSSPSVTATRPAQTSPASVTSPNTPASPTPVAAPRLPALPAVVNSPRPSVHRPPRPGEMENIRANLERTGTPLVAFTTAVDQPIRIEEITPTWAEPGQLIALRGVGLSETTKVLSISTERMQENELTFRVVSDSELEVAAPPFMERRDDCAFVFEVHTPRGVAVTFPRELVDAGRNTIVAEFAVVRRQQVKVAVASFLLLDEQGQLRTVNSARIYSLNPLQPPNVNGVASRIIHSQQSKMGNVTGGDVKAIAVPAVFPCFLDKMFVGPNCRVRRLALQ